MKEYKLSSLFVPPIKNGGGTDDFMNGNRIITIGRQCGSGGFLIGEKLAKKLNIKCYDRELLSRAAKESGFCEEIFQNNDEKPTNSFLYSMVYDSYSLGYGTPSFMDIPLSQKIFLAQFETIKKIASEESCVIIGRCADYALEDDPDLISIFITASFDYRAARKSEKEDIPLDKAKELIIKQDKKRANYYNYYTSKKWGDSSSYDLCINSGKLGEDKCVDLILNYISLIKS